MSTDETPAEVGRRMLEDDAVVSLLGIELDAMADGSATLSMLVRPDMINAAGVCHGGMLTALADAAFAFASNSGGTLALAASITVDFLRPAQEGDRLTAQAARVHLQGRNGLYDVSVRNAEGDLVATLRGRARLMPQRVG